MEHLSIPVAHLDRAGASLGGFKRTARSDGGDQAAFGEEGVPGKTSTTPRQGEDKKRTRNANDKHAAPAHTYDPHMDTSHMQQPQGVFFPAHSGHGIPQQFAAQHQFHAHAAAHQHANQQGSFPAGQSGIFGAFTPPQHVTHMHPGGAPPPAMIASAGYAFKHQYPSPHSYPHAAAPPVSAPYGSGSMPMEAFRQGHAMQGAGVQRSAQHVALSTACSNSKKRPWTNFEDHKLLQVVKVHIEKKFASGDCKPPPDTVTYLYPHKTFTSKLQWVVIAKEMSKLLAPAEPRNSKQCRERFKNNLAMNKGQVALKVVPQPSGGSTRPESGVQVLIFEPDHSTDVPAAATAAEEEEAVTTSGAWSQEEDEELLRLQAEHGNKWAMVAKCLAHKSDSQVKNRWYSLQRKAKRKTVTVHEVVQMAAEQLRNSDAARMRARQVGGVLPTMAVGGGSGGVGTHGPMPTATVPVLGTVGSMGQPHLYGAAVMASSPATAHAPHTHQTPLHGPVSPAMQGASHATPQMAAEGALPQDPRPEAARNAAASPYQGGSSYSPGTEDMPSATDRPSPRERTASNGGSSSPTALPGGLNIMPPFTRDGTSARGSGAGNVHASEAEGARGLLALASFKYAGSADNAAALRAMAQRRQGGATAGVSAVLDAALHSARHSAASQQPTVASSSSSSNGTGNPRSTSANEQQVARQNSSPPARKISSVPDSMLSSQPEARTISGIPVSSGAQLSVGMDSAGSFQQPLLGGLRCVPRLPSLSTSNSGPPQFDTSGSGGAPDTARNSTDPPLSSRGGTEDNRAGSFAGGGVHLGHLGALDGGRTGTFADSEGGDISLTGGANPWGGAEESVTSGHSELDTARLQSGRQASPLGKQQRAPAAAAAQGGSGARLAVHTAFARDMPAGPAAAPVSRAQPAAVPTPVTTAAPAAAAASAAAVSSPAPAPVQAAAPAAAAASAAAVSSPAPAPVQAAAAAAGGERGGPPGGSAVSALQPSNSAGQLHTMRSPAPLGCGAQQQRPASGPGRRLEPMANAPTPQSTGSSDSKRSQGMGSSSVSTDVGSLLAAGAGGNSSNSLPPLQNASASALNSPAVSKRMVLGSSDGKSSSSGGSVGHKGGRAAYMQHRASAGDAVPNQGGSSSSPNSAGPMYGPSSGMGRMVGRQHADASSSTDLQVRGTHVARSSRSNHERTGGGGSGGSAGRGSRRGKPSVRRRGAVKMGVTGGTSKKAWGSKNSTGSSASEVHL